MEREDDENLINIEVEDHQIIERDNLENPVVLIETSNYENRKENSRISQKFGFLEPTVLLYFLAYNLSGAVFQNQVIYQACTDVFYYKESECALLGTSNASKETMDIETQIQPFAAKIFMVRSLIEGIIPALLSLFIGPWCDKFGRKPVMIASFCGNCSIYVILALIAFLSMKYSINPWIYVLASVPVSLTGGNCSLITSVLCYISDVTKEKDRAYRMVIIEVCIYVGLMIGSILSGYLLAATNAVTVFGTSAIILVFAVLYIIFLIKETIIIPMENRGLNKIRELFRWELVKDMFKTCFERRPNYDRMIICLTMLVLGISIFTMEGSMTVFFLFTREKFAWTIKDYTLYDTVGLVIQVFGNMIGVYVLQKFTGMTILSIALFAYGSTVLDSTIKATASYSWELYLANGISFLRGAGSPMCRAILSHIVPASDIGKVYSLATSIESLSALGSAPLYTYAYNMTLSIFPGAFNFISAGMSLICYIFLSIIFALQREIFFSTYGEIGN